MGDKSLKIFIGRMVDTKSTFALNGLFKSTKWDWKSVL
jgi:hypothetical protein